MKFVPMVNPHKPPTKTVHIAIGFFFLVNYIVGVGFLGIPKSFSTAGFFPSFFTLVAISFCAWTTSTWLIEVVSRAQALEDLTPPNRNTACLTPPTPNFRLDADRNTYTPWFLSFSLFSALWAYGTVAGSAWAINLPLTFGPFNMCIESDFDDLPVPGETPCASSYRFCVFLFAVIVIPLSLLDLREQSIVQTVLGIARFTLIGSIVLYCMAKMIQDATEPAYSSARNYSRNYTQEIESFSITGWMGSIPIFLLAQTLQPGLIALTHPIKQKKHMHWLLLAVFIVSSTFYITMGTVVSLWFGDETENTATLNWVPYTTSENSVQLRMLSYLIVLFPSLDVCTTYPLLVCTLVNNLYLIFTGRDTSQTKYGYDLWIRLALRAIVSVLPIVCALLLSNLIYVLTYSGLATFFNFFFFPAALQLLSQRKCLREFGPRQQSRFIDSYNAQEGLESTPLVPRDPRLGRGPGAASLISSKASYWTPYSFPVISHPIFVVMVTIVGGVLFLFSLAGTVLNTVRGDLSL
ncbi:hypothetical protein EMCRGX_G022975 [Ephydatia muelleri]